MASFGIIKDGVKQEYNIGLDDTKLVVTLVASNWTANSDTSTQNAFPYVYTISSALYTNDSTPIWDCIGTASNGIPTETEIEAIGLIQQAYFSTSGVTLYATDEPSVDVVFRAKGVL